MIENIKDSLIAIFSFIVCGISIYLVFNNGLEGIEETIIGIFGSLCFLISGLIGLFKAYKFVESNI